MTNFDTYVASGAMQKTVDDAVLNAAAEASAAGLPVAGPVTDPAVIAAAFTKPPVKPVPGLDK